MIGWVAALGLAAVVLGLLWRYARLPRGGLYLVASALTLALFGYSLQGRPSTTSSTARRAAIDAPEDTRAIEVRRQMYGQFNGDAQWIDFSDTMLRMGATRMAVDATRRGLEKNPNSVPLWVALGNALVAHNQGQLSPAALFAFDRAARIDPRSPAPPFFLGLALARAGEGDAAIDLWVDLLKRTRPDAPWRAEIERRLASLVLARLGQRPGQARVPAPPPPVPVEGSGQADGVGAGARQSRMTPGRIAGGF